MPGLRGHGLRQGHADIVVDHIVHRLGGLVLGNELRLREREFRIGEVVAGQTDRARKPKNKYRLRRIAACDVPKSRRTWRNRMIQPPRQRSRFAL